MKLKQDYYRQKVLIMSREEWKELKGIFRDWKQTAMDGDEADDSGAYADRMKRYDRWMKVLENPEP